MAALKAPRSDGFLVIFYKEYWEIVGGNLVKAVISFFESGRMLREVNNSFVVLIPKNQSLLLLTILDQFVFLMLCTKSSQG